MKIRLTLIIVAIIIFATGNLFSQSFELKRSVIGSGGNVFSENPSDGTKLSSEAGQVAIFSLFNDGDPYILHQGFWVPDTTSGVGVEENKISLSERLVNYPNPFNHNTTIKYLLPGNGFVTIKIFDMVGRLKNVLVQEFQSQGEHQIIWDGKDNDGVDCSAGSYIYELHVIPSQTLGYGSFEEFQLRNVMVIVR